MRLDCGWRVDLGVPDCVQVCCVEVHGHGDAGMGEVVLGGVWHHFRSRFRLVVLSWPLPIQTPMAQGIVRWVMCVPLSCDTSYHNEQRCIVRNVVVS
jgi:hypothetical protein